MPYEEREKYRDDNNADKDKQYFFCHIPKETSIVVTTHGDIIATIDIKTTSRGLPVGSPRDVSSLSLVKNPRFREALRGNASSVFC